ncbi:response regulator [Antarcticibacterium flavum]|uniref:Response regulator n=1 Tax=Antarcticibacterium flavum TaxID=2058175 RepID=A0A5B7X2E8_9FLAO|nr:response regulator [Antarcticibacterium flavum]MCM4159838.1 response regulator [Antarcticibacterium sp. W02-3]QCY68841.1 response regulator [Antarcticibacterium flavum]
MRDKYLQTIIVDDDQVIGQMQLFMLKKMGIEDPRFFLDGKGILDYLDSEENTGQEFFILLDLNMPGMNGWDFLEAIKDKPYAYKLHIVIVTSSLFRDDIKRSKNYPRVIGYFQKSLSVQEFKEIIALQEEIPVPKD